MNFLTEAPIRKGSSAPGLPHIFIKFKDTKTTQPLRGLIPDKTVIG